MASTAAAVPPARSSQTSSPFSNSASAASVAAGARQRPVPNGVTNRPKSQNESKNNAQPTRESNTPDKHAHDRLIFLLANLHGHVARITVKTGEQYSGVFAGASSLESSGGQFVMKMTKKVGADATNGSQEPTDGYVGYGDEHALTFDAKDIVDFSVPSVTIDKGQTKLTNGSSFRTDTDISGNLAVRERELQRWEPSSDSTFDMSLNDLNGGGWDQFRTNERLYGVKSDYDENIYTTAIDRTNPSYKQRALAAEQTARRIEQSTANDAHTAEERGLSGDQEDGLDEEDKFSGVRREIQPLTPSQNNGSRYTPPARRAPTGHATVSGAPVDPAIISSQLARPDSSLANVPKIQSTTSKDHKILAQPAPATAPKASQEAQATSIPGQKKEAPDSKAQVNALSEANKLNTTALPKLDTAEKTAVPLETNNNTENIGKNVLTEFKKFSGAEKLKYHEKQRQTLRKEKEVKINDLKKFAANFKLKSAVPTDMLGILAKSKTKQVEIVEKSQRQLEEQSSPSTAAVLTPTAEQSTPATPSTGKPDSSQGQAGVTSDRPIVRNPRSQHGHHPDFQQQRSDRPHISAHNRAPPGNLGSRLIAQQQKLGNMQQPYSVQDMRIPPYGGPRDAAPRGGASNAPSSANSASSRFNVQAIEFKPSSAVSTVLPVALSNGGPSSPVRPNRSSPLRVSSTGSFFGDKKPRSASEKKSIKDAFNPIMRMKSEVQADSKGKQYTENGGIPQAYRTPPTWEVSEANQEKTYVDMFQAPVITPSSIPATAEPMPHQHQLPLHLQGPQVMSSINSHPPQHHHHVPQHGRDQHFDDLRMQQPSVNSSAVPSPRFQQPPVMMQPHMFPQMQPAYGQPMQPFGMGPNGQQMMVRQYGNNRFNAQQMHTPPPMMTSHSNGGTMMSIPMQPPMQMYSPGQAQAFPVHAGGSHSSNGPNGFSSPRTAPMMAHSGSQQGGAPMMYMSHSQQGQPMYPQHPGQMQQMRGMPVQHHPSYGPGPHMQQHYPGPHRGGSFSGNFNHHQAPHNPAMHHQGQPPATVNHNHEHDEMK